VIYRDRFSVSSMTTGCMSEPISSTGMPIPLVVVSILSNTSGWWKKQWNR